MGRIQGQNHDIEAFYYGASRMLERTSYYGLRSIIILYMVGETLKMNSEDAIGIYGWIISSLVFSQIIGGLLGDLLIGNKKAVIVGGIIQAIGAFSLCIPSIIGLYIGLFLVVLGSGFYTPNIISNFGKLYLDKIKLLDSGFTLFYLAVNLGSFLGVLLIGYSGEKYGYDIGFIVSGLLMLLSIVPIFILKEKIPKKINRNELSLDKRILKVFITLIVVGLFWGIYEISNMRTFELQLVFSEILPLNISKSLWQSINTIFILPISLIAIVLWTYFYSTQSFKLMCGFILGAISFGILLLIPKVPAEHDIILYLLSLLFLSISEIYIAPIFYSILTKYTNPKYLAIVISLAFVPARLFTMIFGLFNDRFYESPSLGLNIGISVMTIVSFGLVVYVLLNKKATYNNVHKT